MNIGIQFNMMIDEIEGIVVMVYDQQKALKFYIQKLGFEKKLDTDIAGYSWIAISPKNSKHEMGMPY